MTRVPFILFLVLLSSTKLISQVRTFIDDTTYHYHRSEEHWRLDHAVFHAYRLGDHQRCASLLDSLIHLGHFNNGLGQHDHIGIRCLDKLGQTDRVIDLLTQILDHGRDYFCDAPVDARRQWSARVQGDARFHELCPDYPHVVVPRGAALNYTDTIQAILLHKDVERSWRHDLLARLAVADILVRGGYPHRRQYPEDRLHLSLFSYFMKCEDSQLLERFLDDLRGSLRPQRYARLLDHHAVLVGRPQHYGSQWRMVDGERSYYPVTDPEHCDARRMRVGLTPWVMQAGRDGIDLPYAPR